MRVLNEDSVIVEPRLFAVADGMGGHAAGEVASGIAIDTLRSLAWQAETRPDDVLAAIDQANQQILAFARNHAEHTGMGTTLAGLGLVTFVGSQHWMIFNVGDSRVYGVGAGGLRRLSVDHSEVEELIEAGEITEDQARVHPRRNVITRSLGTHPAPVPDTWMLPVESGQRFLICSDGLILELTEDQVAQVLAEECDSQKAADRLVADAVRAGGRDNVSVIVVEVVATEAMPARADSDDDIATGPRIDDTQPRLRVLKEPL
jgi:protein phosphatase